ncbi:aldehyde dehydrogenase family protein [Prauserella sp. ASG 168]|uniref:Aldehyde dehydrogenase family protein n=1 Tax=Prauserella cavernicola TaxID=2800127 RepID=A0A934V7I0_9PSEU|nr:aldehyde dehydrogenase family protein [Prauserella cavernicola]
MLRGTVPDGPGYYTTPAVFTDVDPGSRIAQEEEVFGPVLAVTAFDDEEHALALANDSRYGLGAGVWTSDVSAPATGLAACGIGADGGRERINAYTRPKAVFVSLL